MFNKKKLYKTADLCDKNNFLTHISSRRMKTNKILILSNLLVDICSIYQHSWYLLDHKGHNLTLLVYYGTWNDRIIGFKNCTYKLILRSIFTKHSYFKIWYAIKGMLIATDSHWPPNKNKRLEKKCIMYSGITNWNKNKCYQYKYTLENALKINVLKLFLCSLNKILKIIIHFSWTIVTIYEENSQYKAHHLFYLVKKCSLYTAASIIVQ